MRLMSTAANCISDVKFRVIRIPAAEPGSIVGYEYETEEQPMILQDQWEFQDPIPVMDARYSLELPSGWTYETKWANYPESKPSAKRKSLAVGALQCEAHSQGRRHARHWQGVAGQMVVYFVPPGENATTPSPTGGRWANGITSSPSPGLMNLPI